MRGTARICVHATSADLCKALSQLNDKIVDACGKEKLLNNMQGASGRCVGVAYVISVCTAASPVKSTQPGTCHSTVHVSHNRFYNIFSQHRRDQST